MKQVHHLIVSVDGEAWEDALALIEQPSSRLEELIFGRASAWGDESPAACHKGWSGGEYDSAQVVERKDDDRLDDLMELDGQWKRAM